MITNNFSRVPFLLLCLLGFFFISSASSLEAATGNIAGQVRDNFSSDSIPNATIVVLENNIQVATTNTDINGNYTVPHLDIGNYVVIASAVNFQTALQGATVQTDLTTPADFSLEGQPGTLTGTVRDAPTNSPMSNAIIQVFQSNVLVSTTATDTNGLYTISGIPEGSYTVNASHVNFQTVILGTSISPNQITTLNFFLLIQTGTIAGTVTDVTNSSPIVGAVVNIFQSAISVAFGVTDVNGNYTVSGIPPPGVYTVQASAANFQNMVKGATVQTNMTTMVDFALFQQPSSIAGLVTDLVTNLPIAGVVIDAYKNNILVASAVTNADGSYTLPTVSQGLYIVIANKTNYQTLLQPAIVQIGITTPVDFKLTADPGTLIGQVNHLTTSLPVAGATITVSQGIILITSTVTDTSGNYVVPNLAPGSYIVTAAADHFTTVSQGAIVISDQTTEVNFLLGENPGQINGHVSNDTTSSPIPGTTINISQGVVLIATALTDSSGNYVVPNLAPGSYIVTAAVDHFAIGAQGAIVLSDQTAVVNFLLEENPGQIKGNVSNAVTSAPIPHATIKICQENVLIASTLTDANGNYVVPNLAPGNYNVKADVLNFQIQIKIAILESDHITLVNLSLQEVPGNLIGHVVNSTTNAPIPGANIDVFQELLLIASTLNDANGNYIIPSLPPGEYVARAAANNYQTATQPILIQLNQTSTANFALQSDPGSLIGKVINGTKNIPIPGALVNLIKDGSLIATTLTDGEGNYAIHNLAPGDCDGICAAFNIQTPPASVAIQSNLVSILDFVLLFEIPLPPQEIDGAVLYIRYLTQKDIVHHITWEPSLSLDVIAYHIYQNNVRVATVRATASLIYDSHNQNSGVPVTYTVKAVNSLGNESDGVSYVLRS